MNNNIRGGIFGEALCTGSQAFVVDMEDAPANFCRSTFLQWNMSVTHNSNPTKHVDFDEYALERVMIGRWLESSEFAGNDLDQNVDAVVVPSFGLHNSLANGFVWDKVTKSILMAQRQYWKMVRERLYRPKHNFTPVVIIHQPYTWVKNQPVDFLKTLLEQPKGFVDRVVIGTIESNLRPEVRESVKMPSAWDEFAAVEIQRRSGLQDVASASDDVSRGSPLMVTLPYPTPILRPAKFTMNDGLYRSARPRKILISLFASPGKTGQGGNWIRPLLIKKLRAFTNSQSGFVCHHRRNDRTDPNAEYCGLSKEKRGLWNVLVNSAFCLEPAGDTLTRSHFYLAVLAGCVPFINYIFDGGHRKYSDSVRTAWAWRNVALEREGADDDESNMFINYDEIAVIFNATDVAMGKVDVFQELSDMLANSPARFEALRQGLERVAPRMRYTSGIGCHTNCDDAFSAFRVIAAGAAGVKLPGEVRANDF
eukprot:CAMPEP_0117620608 /NCGR_PEP_ID=MMETSP0784-20121206/87213_1 /TAXON_ID=39447 /ORGANISM="" /LENGTH=479 /DNA_ID=CAMNT_0005424521 /DNA_START=218 /DNA_END=1657 /DNA_ORIENTATION=+